MTLLRLGFSYLKLDHDRCFEEGSTHSRARKAVPRQCDRSDSIISRRSLVLDDRASRLVLRQIGL